MTETGSASASRLWGRAREGVTQGAHAVRTAVDPHQVIMERSAVWLPADTPETAARARADLTALAQHLRAIGVDGDGLVWIPRGELVTAEDLATLLRDAPAAGLLPLIGVASHAAANLAGLAGATLIHRIAEPALASRLAELTGTWMLPVSAAAAPGAPSMPGTDLVRCPVIPPRSLHALRRGEFVLAVTVPRRRLIALGRLIPARLPRREEPPRRREPQHWAEPPRQEEPHRQEAPPHRQEAPPHRQEAPPYRQEPPDWAELPHRGTPRRWPESEVAG